jgi:hypothetical protein
MTFKDVYIVNALEGLALSLRITEVVPFLLPIIPLYVIAYGFSGTFGSYLLYNVINKTNFFKKKILGRSRYR